jgi:hypothetical protein
MKSAALTLNVSGQCFAPTCWSTPAGRRLTLRRQAGYGHSYYFVSTYMEDHMRWHAARLKS